MSADLVFKECLYFPTQSGSSLPSPVSGFGIVGPRHTCWGLLPGTFFGYSIHWPLSQRQHQSSNSGFCGDADTLLLQWDALGGTWRVDVFFVWVVFTMFFPVSSVTWSTLLMDDHRSSMNSKDSRFNHSSLLVYRYAFLLLHKIYTYIYIHIHIYTIHLWLCILKDFFFRSVLEDFPFLTLK